MRGRVTRHGLYWDNVEKCQEIPIPLTENGDILFLNRAILIGAFKVPFLATFVIIQSVRQLFIMSAFKRSNPSLRAITQKRNRFLNNSVGSRRQNIGFIAL